MQLLTVSSFSTQPPPQILKKLLRKLLIQQLIITKIGLFQLYNNAKNYVLIRKIKNFNCCGLKILFVFKLIFWQKRYGINYLNVEKVLNVKEQLCCNNRYTKIINCAHYLKQKCSLVGETILFITTDTFSNKKLKPFSSFH